MYCPRCGQQQISDEMRFCSRCGLPITGLVEWLNQEGVPVQFAGEIPAPPPSPRRKGMRRAAKLMFLGGVLFPVFLAISLALDDGGPMFIPIAIIFASVIWMLYARLFSPANATISQAAQPPVLRSAPAAGALPPASNTWMHGVGEQRVRTKELAQPPSVSEHTTKLLDQD